MLPPADEHSVTAATRVEATQQSDRTENPVEDAVMFLVVMMVVIVILMHMYTWLALYVWSGRVLMHWQLVLLVRNRLAVYLRICVHLIYRFVTATRLNNPD